MTCTKMMCPAMNVSDDCDIPDCRWRTEKVVLSPEQIREELNHAKFIAAYLDVRLNAINDYIQALERQKYVEAKKALEEENV